MNIRIGSFVENKNNNRGIAKVVDIKKNNVTIEYFKSIADREFATVNFCELKQTKLHEQTRCYHFNEKTQRWQIGRTRNYIEQKYEVDFPDIFSTYIDEKDIYVRCNRPIDNPSDVLKLRGHETAFFNNRRTLFINTLMEQRSVSQGMDGLMSSNILLFPHQVEVVKRVLEDPVQRYILADEVGLGKTIEAGVIVRQYLLDHPTENVLFIVPPFLFDQWKSEMEQRFAIEDFEDRVDWLTLDNLDKLSSLDKDHNMIVIDEAHEVASFAYSMQKNKVHLYKELCNKVHVSAGLLLLSATPVLNNEKEFLAMLHLIDPDHYTLDQLNDFKNRIQKRQEVGRLLLSFHENSRPFMIRRFMKKLSKYFPQDYLLQNLLDKLEYSLEEEQSEENRKKYIRNIRVHLSETYRLHRRLLRNRRSAVDNQLKFGRGKDSDQVSVKYEYDLDIEKNNQLMNVLDEWRNAAWASELDYWEQDDVLTSELLSIFFIIFEAANSSTRLFKSVLTSRIKLIADPLLEEELTKDQIALITKTPHFTEEEILLNQLLRIAREPSEEGDKLTLLSMLVQMLKLQDESKKNKPPKIVVFSNFTVVAKEVTAYLKNEYGADSVSSYNRFMKREDVELEVDLFGSSDDCFILVCDSSGEEGRNLQFADVIVHFDSPVNPNRIEQRTGRLDRIGREQSYKTYILGGTEETNTLATAWHSFLMDGLKVFHTSISSLQFFIEEMMPYLRREFYIKGTEGILNIQETIDEQMNQEKVKIAEQHALDEIDINSNDAEGFYNKLKQYEEDFEIIEDGFDPWICEALALQKIRNEQSLFTFFYKPRRGTLIPLNFLLPISYALDRPGSYDREEVIYHKECNLYRIGNPFIEILRNYIQWDDRGQTFAIWRKSNKVGDGEGEEVVAFVLNYIVEGDVSYAQEVVRDYKQKGIDENALQRRLDYYFPPLFKTTYADIEGNNIVDEQYLTELKQSFKKVEEGGTDWNLTKDKLNILNEFIPEQYWGDTIDAICHKSLSQLTNNESFLQLCEDRYKQAQHEHKYMYSQMQLRFESGEYTGHKSYQSKSDLDFEKSLQEALQQGVLNPKITLDSIGFIVLTGKELERDYGRISTIKGSTLSRKY